LAGFEAGFLAEGFFFAGAAGFFFALAGSVP